MIRDIYRPVIDADWGMDLKSQVASYPDNPISINEPREFRVRLIKPAELSSVSSPASRSSEYIATQLKHALEGSFETELPDVYTTGVSFVRPNYGKKHGAILLKLAQDARLIDENDRISDVLSQYGFTSENVMLFNVIIGAVAVRELGGGEARIRARLQLGSLLPAKIVLGPGVIKTSSDSQA